MSESNVGPKRCKIWRNPRQHRERPHYMGEFLPPVSQGDMTAQDLRDLGFATGSYTVRFECDDAANESGWKRIDLK